MNSMLTSLVLRSTSSFSWRFLYSTTGNRHFAECRRLCRVYFIGHSAKTALPSVFFRHSTKMALRVFFSALGKDVFCRVPFFDTRQNVSLPSAFFWHSAKMYFDECHFSALGKMRLCRVPFSGTRQICILPSAIFWHSAKYVFAECLFFDTRQRGILLCAFFFALDKLFF